MVKVSVEKKLYNELKVMIKNYSISSANQFLDITLNEDDIDDIEQRIGEPLTTFLADREQLGNARPYILEALKEGTLKPTDLKEMTAFLNDRINMYWRYAHEDVSYILNHNRDKLENKCINEWKVQPEVCKAKLDEISTISDKEIFKKINVQKPVLTYMKASEWLKIS